MADISQDLQKILDAIYGEEVRGSIYHAISLINDVSEKVIDAGTVVTGAASSSTGYYKDSLYINTSTYDLWRCIGTDSWTLLGNIKGAVGKGISSIAKTSTSGLVDTYTITYSDGTTTTFNITNGKDGTDGNDGVSVTGVSLLSKVGLLATYRMSFSNGTYFDYTVSDGASGSGTGDMTKAVYDTDNDGIVDAAKTLSGLIATIADLNKTASLATVATSGSYNDLSDKPTIPTVDQTYNATSSNAQSGKAVAEVVEQIYADNGVLGAKNLLPNNATSQTINGVTFTVNDDGSVTVNGTSGGSAVYLTLTEHLDTSSLAGCLVSGLPVENTADIAYRIHSQSSYVSLKDFRENNDVLTDVGNDVRFSIRIAGGGITVNNLTFYPMLRLASDPDDTYVPYVMTNRELTEAIASVPTVNNGQLTIQQNGTNKATFTANQSENATANIVTDEWTTTRQVQSDGTVTFTGLNDSYSYSRPYYELPSGDSAYTFSKATKSGSGTSVTLTYTTDAPSGTVCKLRILK